MAPQNNVAGSDNESLTLCHPLAFGLGMLFQPSGAPREVGFVFEPQDEGGYHDVHAPELPGLHTQGDSLDEATPSRASADAPDSGRA